MDPVRYEWNEAKRKRNLAKHGMDFGAIERFVWATSSAGTDDRDDYGETRILAYGLLDGRLHAVVYTHRGSFRRIISLRKANRREQEAYAARMARGRG